MAVINRERFIELATDTNPDNALKTSQFIREAQTVLTNSAPNYRTYYTENGMPRIMPAVNREAAITMFEAARAYLLSRGFFNGKSFRPWEMDDQLYAKLDRSEAWWGFEFETGYVNHEARAEVLSDVWDRWDNVAFDAEGEGDVYCEITFAPQERSRFTDGTALAAEFMQYLCGSPHLTNETDYSEVGTHFNLSHPELQSNHKVAAMAKVLNNSIHMLPTRASRNKLFGRSELYGGFFSRSNEAATSHWLEGKLFRTTYDNAQFQEYLRVCEALTKCVEAVLAYWEEEEFDNKLAISNLMEVVYGAAPNITRDTRFDGSPWGAWINNCHSRSGGDAYIFSSSDAFDESDEPEVVWDEPYTAVTSF